MSTRGKGEELYEAGTTSYGIMEIMQMRPRTLKTLTRGEVTQLHKFLIPDKLSFHSSPQLLFFYCCDFFLVVVQPRLSFFSGD